MAKLKIPSSLADHCRALVNIAPLARMDSNEVIKVNIIYVLYILKFTSVDHDRVSCEIVNHKVFI